MSGRHGVDLRLRRRLHVDGGVDLHLRRHRLLAPLRQRRDLVAGLDLVHGVVVRRAVGLGAADDPDIGRRRIDALRVVRQPEFLDEPLAQVRPPARRRDQEIACFRSGGAPARRGEHVGPHVEHRQQIVAAAGVRHRDDHRLLGQIEPAARIERIEIRPNHDLHVGGGKRSDIGEAVHRAADAPGLGLLIGELLSGHVHGDEGIEIEIGVDADGVRLFLCDSGGSRRARGRCKQKSEGQRERKPLHQILQVMILRWSNRSFGLVSNALRLLQLLHDLIDASSTDSALDPIGTSVKSVGVSVPPPGLLLSRSRAC